MPFAGVRPLARAFGEEGASWRSYVFKTSGPTPGAAGRWVDLSMGAGTPVYNAYVGDQAAATPLVGGGNRGIYTGPTPLPGQTKHLLQMQSLVTQAVVPMTLALVDLLMVYPLIDGDATDPQDLDNVFALPRYASGYGVEAFLVCTTPMTGNGQVQIDFTDDLGQAQTQTFGVIGNGAGVGQIVHSASAAIAVSARTPFIPLSNGDHGIRSVQRVTNLSSMGGFYAVVLCRPIAHQLVRERNVVTEHNLPMQKGSLPRIFDGAYLNLLALTGNTGALTPLRTELSFTWGA